MCEALVCVKSWTTVNGSSGSLSFDYSLPQQGDVIWVGADGAPWGVCEQGLIYPGNPNGNHNFWRILKLPNVTVNQASTMLAPEVNVDPTKPSPYLQFRAFFLDKTKIPAGVLATYWNDDTRAAPFISMPYTATQLATLKTQRTPVPF